VGEEEGGEGGEHCGGWVLMVEKFLEILEIHRAWAGECFGVFCVYR